MREPRKSITGYLELGMEIIDPLKHCSSDTQRLSDTPTVDSTSALVKMAQEIPLCCLLLDEESSFLFKHLPFISELSIVEVYPRPRRSPESPTALKSMRVYQELPDQGEK